MNVNFLFLNSLLLRGNSWDVTPKTERDDGDLENVFKHLILVLRSLLFYKINNLHMIYMRS